MKRLKENLIEDLEREYNKEREFVNQRESNMLYNEDTLLQLRQ